MEVEHQKKSTDEKRRRKKGNDDVGKAAPISTMGENCLEMNKQSRKKKRKNKDKNGSSIGNFDQLGSREVEDGFDKQNDGALNQFETQGKIKSSKEPTEADAGTVIKTRKSKKVKKNKKGPVSSEKDGNILESGGEAKRDGVYHISSGDEDCSKGMKNGALNQFDTQGKIKNSKEPTEANAGTVIKTRKSKKVKKNKKDPVSSEKDGNILESGGEAKRDGVYHISSGDEDCSKGMKKWVMEYHQSRPGLKILQQRIDDFIMTHEAQQEQERKEKEARAAEGGWTVVVHHKGRKKTTDSESGITVGSVAQAAVEDKMAKKKRKDVGLDFYRFQRREAKRNEVMLLQSKFEQDRKRIQQLRAARKFRPY